ncbi:MAG: M15 family metallopeptidase [Phreatobacter sp.]|uniref:M15 family metallopeptidase n=1 Tax=Phreatobacter sp. TaxID=1966341 RepID=UPI001A46FDC5|nr:M15 family metallopeptidase [Phreatobacter sp.]MBL8569506.1 M15 family metallopeptidase [Phreatobacter sp.]
MNRRAAALCALAVLAAPRVVRAQVPMRERLTRLVAAYPDHLAGIDDDTLIWTDGTRMPTGADHPARPFDIMLKDATIADQLRQDYSSGRPDGPPPRDHSPGRLRHTALFVKMYGDCRRAAAAGRHRFVTWMPRTRPQDLPVTAVNDVAGRLDRVIGGLEGLPDRFRAYLVPSAGTFNCRTVADTGLLSMHAFAAAIDLNVQHSDYWRWARSRGDIPYRNRIPYEIVEVFEAEKFIWGGKWYHYDTMHFEYRPELFG